MLNTKNAFRLYSLVEAHLPEELGGDVYDFIGKILQSMISSGEHRNYAIAIQMMHDVTLSQLAEMEPIETAEMFTEGLVENKILKLHGFCEGIG